MIAKTQGKVQKMHEIVRKDPTSKHLDDHGHGEEVRNKMTTRTTFALHLEKAQKRTEIAHNGHYM